MKANLLRESDLQWIRDHEWWFTGLNRTLNRDQVTELFQILSWIEGRHKAPTGCGRCVTSAKERIWQEYIKQTKE